MPRLLRSAPARVPEPYVPSLADVDECLCDITEERARHRNHSGRWTSTTFRLNKMLEARLVLSDRLVCAAWEALW
jgi:hypothetical protein